MTSSSLRLRLLVAWAVFILLALQLAAVGLRVLFERAITRRTIAELEFDLRQLSRGLNFGPNGEIGQSRRPTDPQFEALNGGRYWQVSEDNRALLRSVSLGSQSLTLPILLREGGSSNVLTLFAPDGQQLLSVMRYFKFEGERVSKRRLVLVSAVNASEIQEDADKFSHDLLLGLGGLAALLLVGAWAHVSIGLSPLNRLRASLASIRTGRQQRIAGTFPTEIMPLVDETNALLDAQDHAIEAARARAGDLAHGLKTPLAVMSAKSRGLRQAGAAAVADDIDRQIETMRRHVQRELARARARGRLARGAAMLDLTTATRELISAVQTLPRARTLDWSLDLEPNLAFPVDGADYNDMLGNLVDNAQKWAQSKVRVLLRHREEAITIVVEDDGTGVPDDLIDEISLRGVRADSGIEGSGLGLAIVGDVVALYGGALKLTRSTLGGLRVSIDLPGQAMSLSS